MLLRLYTGTQGAAGNVLLYPPHLEDGEIPCLHLVDFQARRGIEDLHEQDDGPRSYFLIPSECIDQHTLVQHCQSISNNKSTSLRTFLASDEVSSSNSKPKAFPRPVDIEGYLLRPARDFNCPESDLVHSIARFYNTAAEGQTDGTVPWTSAREKQTPVATVEPVRAFDADEASGTVKEETCGGDLKEAAEQADNMAWARAARSRLFS